MSPDDRPIVIIGMMGAGKSTIGRLLAQRLGRRFWDNDDALLEATGKTAAELQRVENQPALHRWENRLLRAALQTPTPTVFAAAGSVALDPDLLRDALTIWLRIGPEREAENLARSGQHHRPLPDDPSATLERMKAERERLYSKWVIHLTQVPPVALAPGRLRGTATARVRRSWARLRPSGAPDSAQ
jgi:shikimate kinase